MSNPTFFTGNLTKEAGAPVTPFRFVSLKDGRVQHADGSAVPYGAVTAAAAPKEDRRDNDLSYGVPHLVRVHASQCVVEIETADEFKVGDTVYAAKDGKAAKSGKAVAGLAERETRGGRVRVHLFHPAAAATATPAPAPAGSATE